VSEIHRIALLQSRPSIFSADESVEVNCYTWEFEMTWEASKFRRTYQPWAFAFIVVQGALISLREVLELWPFIDCNLMHSEFGM
jgi:hypothetical protein